MIALDSVSVRYGNRVALSDVSLQIGQGSVYALLGRNGAGKSSLIKVLLGQRRADSGAVSVFGLDPWKDRKTLMADVGATPESPDAPPGMRVERIARSIAALYREWDQEGLHDRLQRFSIDPRNRFSSLSRGQRSLVMLALALAQRPDLLILDDPTLGLDAVARRFFFEDLVVELADRKTSVLLATHDLEGVERVATDVGILSAGKLIANGSLEDVRNERPLEEVFVGLVDTGDAAR